MNDNAEELKEEIPVGKVYGEYKVTAVDDAHITYVINPISRWLRLLFIAFFIYAALVANSMLLMTVGGVLVVVHSAIFYWPARHVRADIKFAQNNKTAVVNGSPMSFSNPTSIRIFRNGGKRS